MAFPLDDDVRVAEQATRWFASLLEGDDNQVEFFKWLEESPRHVEEFMRVVHTAVDIAGLSLQQRERIEQFARELGSDEEASTKVVPISCRALAAFEDIGRAARNDDGGQPSHVLVPQVQPAAKPPLSVRWTVRVAAMVLIALTAFLWINSALGWRSYSTGVGEQRQIALPDGSRVAMNTDSEISIHLTKSSRTIQLVRGEALFTVAHDPKRPFDVQVGQTVIRAIGTEFDVYRQSAGTRVTVIHGLVQVSTGDVVPPFPNKPDARSTDAPFATDSAISGAQHSEKAQLVAAGEAALISVSGEISHHSDVDPDKTAAWRRSRLVFENETLASIAAEFNRYNTLKIRVEGKVADQHFSGTFDANKPLSVMQVLAADSALQVERIGNEIVIRARERAGMNLPQPYQVH